MSLSTMYICITMPSLYRKCSPCPAIDMFIEPSRSTAKSSKVKSGGKRTSNEVSRCEVKAEGVVNSSAPKDMPGRSKVTEKRKRCENTVPAKPKRKKQKRRNVGASEEVLTCARTRPWTKAEHVRRANTSKPRRRRRAVAVRALDRVPAATESKTMQITKAIAAAEDKAKTVEARSRSQRMLQRQQRVGTGVVINAPDSLTSEVRVRFGRSNVHSWGVFSEDNVRAGDMILEYRGEVIRSSVADVREQRRLGKGIDDYMFRISKNVVIDATTSGSLARFLNHSCDVRSAIFFSFFFCRDRW